MNGCYKTWCTSDRLCAECVSAAEKKEASRAPATSDPATSLCTHDPRNTDGCSCAAAGITCPGVTNGCGCDNCFYGRHALANALIHAADLVARSVTAKELRVLRHMLGSTHSDVVGDDGRCKPLGWRNYGAWDENDAAMNSLVERGIAVASARRDGMVYTHVTKSWADALGAVSS